jgi:hypothetical protein
MCNNNFGHRIQSQLAKLLEVNESLRGSGELRGRFTVYEETIPVEVQVKPNTGLKILVRGGSPKTIDAIHLGVKSRTQSMWSLQMKFPYSPGKASAAIAHAAYLAAFRHFGYSYILSEPVRTFRAEIVSAMEKHSERLAILTGTTRGTALHTGNEPDAVIIPAALDSGCEYLLAMLRFHRNRDYWMFCVLPDVSQPNDRVFEDLKDAAQILGMCDIRMAGDEAGGVTAEFLNRSAVPSIYAQEPARADSEY